jgi:L-2,4-diaminobutyrate decarboxylase
MNILDEVFDSESFRKNGHQLVDMLAEALNANLTRNAPKAIDFVAPDESYKWWSEQHFEQPVDFFKAVLERSIRLQHPRYIGHQVCTPAPLAVLAGFEGLMLNSGGAIYEMSAASSTLEKRVIDLLKRYFGFHEGDGIFTSGGTLANLTALICARNIKAKENVWQEGQYEKYAFLVSEEAHYCIDRAVRVMGWGDTGIIKVPVDHNFRMRTELLPFYCEAAQKNGIHVLGVVGSAPTTSTGIYDDLESIGVFCRQHNLWFHIDAAHGGPAAFSEKYRYLMSGSELADSITVDAHKMMMVPSLTTMLFFRNSADSYRTFAQKAQYLWADSDAEWYNYGKRTMECTKIMLSTRLYVLMQTYGVEVFGEHLDRCYDMGRIFADMIENDPEFELAVRPDSNIVCFRVRHEDTAQANLINRGIRQALLEDGTFYIVQTMLGDTSWLRVSIMNSFTSAEDMALLMQKIKELYRNMTGI